MILSVGHQGENLARCVCFPIDGLIEQYGAGTWTVVFKRPFESEPYVVANQEEVGDYAVWGLDATDTAVCGEGRAELRYYVDDTIVKTDVYAASILPALRETGEAPSPYEDLLDQIAGYASDAQTAASSAADSSSDAEAWAVGQRDGTDVPVGDETYQNNAKYYAEQAEMAAKDVRSGLYGAKWDRTTNLLRRTRDAVGITTVTTNFGHFGSFNANYSNPFDSIYPWSDMVVCNVDMTKYRAGTYSLEECITAVYGDPDFTYEGSYTNFVGRYRPEFWYRSEEASDGSVEFLISQSERAGYKHAEAAIDGISFCIDAGDSKVSSGADVPLTNVAVSTIHARAKSSGFTLQDIYTLDQQIILFLVEYANMNSQAALGNGCSDCYRQNAADVVSEVSTANSVTTFKVPYVSALVALLQPGAQLSFGASSGATTYKALLASVTYDTTAFTVTLDRELAITNGMIMSVHGFATCEFPLLSQAVGNASGYIGTNGKANAFYRGALLYANRYSYILGIYRQTGTGEIWICPDGVDPDNYDALNTSVHEDTGVALPELTTAGWQTVGGNAQRITGAAAFMITGESSGSSASPVGDQQYVPLPSAGNTILLFGCSATAGWDCGVFSGLWDLTSSGSAWSAAALPILKSPL